jgi:hypothetical protein
MYYPKSQIIENLYTNGGEYGYFTNPFQEYKGYYYVVSTGQAFSGKNPNDGTPQRLTLLSTKEYSSVIDENNPQSSLLDSQYDDILFKTKQIQNQSSLTEPKYIKPTPSYPAFTRYFVKKTNELRYIEVDKVTYDKILSKDKSYNWAMYKPFTIWWTTNGVSRQEVEKTNKGIVSLAESRQKLYGLTNYFKNYSEFFV